MTNLETVISRDYQGNLGATSRLILSPALRVKISTHKSSGGLIVSEAQVVHVENNCESCMIFEDFSARLAEMKARATETNIVAVHQDALSALDTHLPAIKTQYNLV